MIAKIPVQHYSAVLSFLESFKSDSVEYEVVVVSSLEHFYVIFVNEELFNSFKINFSGKILPQ